MNICFVLFTEDDDEVVMAAPSEFESQVSRRLSRGLSRGISQTSDKYNRSMSVASMKDEVRIQLFVKNKYFQRTKEI